MPQQLEQLKRIAKFNRWVYESKYGDEFGVVIAYSKSLGDPEFDESKLVETVDSERKAYYENLKKLRKKIGEQVLAAMPAEAKTKFTSVYGEELYDYKAEKIATWDKARRASR